MKLGRKEDGMKALKDAFNKSDGADADRLEQAWRTRGKGCDIFRVSSKGSRSLLYRVQKTKYEDAQTKYYITDPRLIVDMDRKGIEEFKAAKGTWGLKVSGPTNLDSDTSSKPGKIRPLGSCFLLLLDNFNRVMDR
jgi:hypothetical protein